MEYQILALELDIYLELVEYAKKMGIKEGENMEKAITQFAKENPKKITVIATTEKDIDLLTGNLREMGFKVLNIKEEERKKEKDNESN